MTKPVRLQLSRKRGFNLQQHSMSVNGLTAINVARPSKWGNPWTIAGAREAGFVGSDREIARVCCSRFYASLVENLPATEKINSSLNEIRGRNLACWCALDAPCHADVLLGLANEDDPRNV